MACRPPLTYDRKGDQETMPIIALAFSAAVLGGGEEPKPKPTPRVCITRRQINAITALDDRHVFVKHGTSRLYLLTLDKHCRELKWARAIELDRSATRVCGDGVSLLSFEQRGAGPTRCRIERIEAVADKEAALDLIDSRAGPR
jgi:hypothetical protein